MRALGGGRNESGGAVSSVFVARFVSRAPRFLMAGGWLMVACERERMVLFPPFLVIEECGAIECGSIRFMGEAISIIVG